MKKKEAHPCAFRQSLFSNACEARQREKTRITKKVDEDIPNRYKSPTN